MTNVELTLRVGDRTVVETYNQAGIRDVSIRSDGDLLVEWYEDYGPADQQIVIGYRVL